MPSAERKKRVKEALERVNMAHRMRHYPAQLSGGQQQRVAVARALAGSPSILLADEPTGNLDSKNGEAVMHLLADLHREGSTICMVTHDPRFAKHAAARSASLRRQGRFRRRAEEAHRRSGGLKSSRSEIVRPEPRACYCPAPQLDRRGAPSYISARLRLRCFRTAAGNGEESR